MRRRGHLTFIGAPERSRVGGKFIATNWPATEVDDLERCRREQVAAISSAIEDANRKGEPFDLVHDHSGLPWRRRIPNGPPWLVTLHLPGSFYPSEVFVNQPDNVFFNCVSQAQAADFGSMSQISEVVENGID